MKSGSWGRGGGALWELASTNLAFPEPRPSSYLVSLAYLIPSLLLVYLPQHSWASYFNLHIPFNPNVCSPQISGLGM